MKKKVKITELSEATMLEGLWILGVNASNKGVRAAMSLLRGLDGKEVEMRTTDTAIQYRLTGGIWKELLSMAIIQKPATDAADAVRKEMTQISEEVGRMISDTEEAKDLALEVANHPTRIDSDCTVEVYDPVSKAYTKTDINVKGDKGNTMYATFHLDPSTGQLAMHTDPEYKGANFEIENGKLMVTL